MSIELLLLFVAFLLVPLVQFLVRAARAGQEPHPAQRAGLPSSVDRLPMREMRQTLVLEDRTVTDGTAAPKPKPARTAHQSVPPAAGGGTGRGRSSLAFREPLDLRRAIVLRTVLGPCRASHSQDWPEADERR